MPEGIIYILTNEAMPGYVKIGKTLNSVAERIKGLDNTSVALPFECFYAARVADMDSAERLLHDAFADSRTRRSREFFTIDPERVRSAIRLAELEDVTPSEDEIVETGEDRGALEGARKRRRNMTLGMLAIEPGAVLTFSKDPSVTCTVADDKRVEFEGELTSISASALKVLHRLGFEWPSVNGWGYWQYKGRTLSEICIDVLEGE